MRWATLVLCFVLVGGLGACDSGAPEGENSNIDPLSGNPQVQTPADEVENLPTLSGDLIQIVEELPYVGKTASALALPSESDALQFRSAFEALIQAKYTEAQTGFSKVGFELIHFTDTGGLPFFLIREYTGTAGRGWGLFAWNPSGSRSLLIEAPHPLADLYTETQAADFFLRLSAKALLVSGSHRCASPQHSPCSGTTTVCGSTGENEPYRISDAAHSPALLFEIAHELLMDSNPENVAVALHGFAQEAQDPHAFISDGTKLVSSPDGLSNQLTALLFQETALAKAAQSCNDGSQGARLCGTEDLQGRYANESPDACEVTASLSHQRFLHVEQSLDLRTPGGSASSDQLLQALSHLFDP